MAKMLPVQPPNPPQTTTTTTLLVWSVNCRFEVDCRPFQRSVADEAQLLAHVDRCGSHRSNRMLLRNALG
jgi:hypothetical protein